MGCNLVENNAKNHCSHAVSEWKTRFGIQSVPFLAPRPDLNTIESVWAVIKTQLRSVKLDFPNLEGAV